MAMTISISHKTGKSLDDITAALDGIFAELSDRYNITGHWKNPRLFVLSGQSIEGSVSVVEGGVELALTVGGLLAPFTPTIEKAVRDEIEKRL